MPPDASVAILVLNWNGWKDTKECLESLRALEHSSTATYVVDNGSTDGSPEKIASLFPEAKLLRLPQNRGFAGGMNAGVQAALEDGHDFVLGLNNDMTVDPRLLEPLLAAAREGKIVPYPTIYQAEEPDVIDNLGHRVNLFTGLTWMVAHGERDPPVSPEADYTELPFLSREALGAVRGWREEYFAFYEDTDLSLRLRKAGWTLLYVPESRVYHRRGRTAGRVHGLVSYYSIRNRLMVVRSHASPWHYLTALLHILLFTIPYIGLRCLLTRGYKHSFRHVLLGLADGLLPWRRNVVRTWQMSPADPPSQDGQGSAGQHRS